MFSSFYVQAQWGVCLFFCCRQRQLIEGAIVKNDFLKKLDIGQISDMVECMEPRVAKSHELIIKEGEVGNEMYVIEGKLVLFISTHAAQLLKVAKRGEFRWQSGGFQGYGAAASDATGTAVWGAGYPLQLHEDCVHQR